MNPGQEQRVCVCCSEGEATSKQPSYKLVKSKDISVPLESPTAKIMRILEHNVRLPLAAQIAPPQLHTIG